MKPADRRYPARWQCAVAAPRSLDDGLLPISSRQENSVTTAVERGISQRDARFGPAAGHGNHPTLRLIKSGLARKQRGGVAVIANAQENHIEQRLGRIQSSGAVIVAQSLFVGGSGLLRRQPFSRYRMNIALRDPLWTRTRRASYRNCCPGGREERSVHRPRTNGRGSRGTPQQRAAEPEAHTKVAASFRRSNR